MGSIASAEVVVIIESSGMYVLLIVRYLTASASSTCGTRDVCSAARFDALRSDKSSRPMPMLVLVQTSAI